MNAYITNIKLCGIKNIDKEITLNFYKQTISKEFTLDQSNIKAIYGENGAGKSAIIHAMDIYKNICLKKNYLQDTQNTKILMELVNKSLKTFSVEVTFIIIEESHVLTKLKHCIRIKLGEDGYFHLIYENITDLSKRKEVCLIEIVDGIIQETSTISNDALKNETKNLLYHQTVIAKWIYDLISLNRNTEKFVEKYGQEIYIIVGLTILMIHSIVIFIFDKDVHDQYESDTFLYRINHAIEKQTDLKMEHTIDLDLEGDLKKYHMINDHADVVLKKNFPSYEDKIKRLSMFMKLIKNNLIDIDIDKRENGSSYICEKNFIYEGYKINIEFESAGIKKLVLLFDTLEAFVNGNIVFIDELDANIHDVILLKMLEYFSVYAKGQLCFTTHNLGPMEVLRNRKFAIDFLSQDSQISSWKKNGHYSVINLYREGMIEHHPFNIEPIDFAGIFEIEEDL